MVGEPKKRKTRKQNREGSKFVGEEEKRRARRTLASGGAKGAGDLRVARMVVRVGQLSDAVSRCVSLFVFEVSHKTLPSFFGRNSDGVPRPRLLPFSSFFVLLLRLLLHLLHSRPRHPRDLFITVETQALFFCICFTPQPRLPLPPRPPTRTVDETFAS